MNIDLLHFTPVASLVGGLLIGLAVALFIFLNGRIAGVSGVLGGLVGGLLRAKAGDAAWRITFVLGLVLSPALYRVFAELPESHIDTSWLVLVVAGVLVGFSTRYGSGCTSGHGVCGLSRLSPRSLVATLSFMGAGFATVYVVRHLLGSL